MSATQTANSQPAATKEMIMSMYALTSTGRTAAYETALCADCYAISANQDYARRQPKLHTNNDILDGAEFTDCTGNDALECQVCGKVEV